MKLALRQERRNTIRLESKLTKLQAALQDYLRTNSGETFSREQLCSAVWRMNFYQHSRTIDQTISVVRKHLDEEERIVTVFGIGYRHKVQRRHTSSIARL